MATTKKAAAAAEKETTKAVKAAEKETVKAEKAPAKKAPAKKAAPKKTAPKKPAEAEAKVETKETKVNFFVEFGGVQVPVEEVVNNIKATIGKDAAEIAVYLKPEESKAYYVADGETGEMDVFFC